MTLQAPKRIRRCALTGVQVGPRSRVIIERIPSHRTKPGYLQAEGNLIAAPLTINRSQMDGRVGLAYAVMMARYLDIALAEQRQALSLQERLELIAWWDIDADGGYGVRRVRRKLVAELREKMDDAVADAKADHIITVAVTCHLEKADPDEIGPRFGHDGHWVRRIVDWTFRLANRRGSVEVAR